MTVDEKMSIARGVVTPLLRKIRAGKSYFLSIVNIWNISRSSM
jgi:hypothetical protein